MEKDRLKVSENLHYLASSSNTSCYLESGNGSNSPNLIGSEANLALNYFDKQTEYTKDEERTVRWKIDLRTIRMSSATQIGDILMVIDTF